MKNLKVLVAVLLFVIFFVSCKNDGKVTQHTIITTDEKGKIDTTSFEVKIVDANELDSADWANGNKSDSLKLKAEVISRKSGRDEFGMYYEEVTIKSPEGVNTLIIGDDTITDKSH